MTTHNHHDQNDVDAPVVEPTSAPESMADASSSVPTIDAASSSPEQSPNGRTEDSATALSPTTTEPSFLAENSEEVASLSGPSSSDVLLVQSSEEEMETSLPDSNSSTGPVAQSTATESTSGDVSPASPIEEVPMLPEALEPSPASPASHQASVTAASQETPTSLIAENDSVIQEQVSDQQPISLVENQPAILEESQSQSPNVAEEQTPMSQESFSNYIEDQSSPVVHVARSTPEEDDSTQFVAEDQPISTEVAALTAESAATTSTEEAAFPYASILSFADSRNEELRSFSDIIEEFRQAEALQEAHVDFSLLPDIEIPSEIFEGSSHDAITLPNASSSPELRNAEVEAKQEESVQKKEVESQVNQDVMKTNTEKQEIKPDLVSGQLTPTPITRVSPLLRPASRLRVPRHSSRHHREEPVPQDTLPAEPLPAPAPVELPALEEPAPDSTPAEQPRPARRYRFDRPSTGGNNATRPAPASSQTSAPAAPVTPSRPEAPQEKEPAQSRGFSSLARQESGRQEAIERQEPQASEPPSPPTIKNGSHSQAEQTKGAQAQSEPAPVVETNENGRRRHHERQPKEQPAPNPAPQPAAEIVLPAQPVQPSPSVQPDVVAPEDLPPLEYADLQKANPRRRRRHRNSPPAASNGTGHGTPEAPAAQSMLPLAHSAPTPAAQVPAEPASRLSDNAFSIVSGYTVNQMNQNEVTGPFMGPEPSPARGSVVSRDGRTTRAEMQRTPIYPPALRTTHEAGLSSSSLNHLANVVSQSIQQSIQLQTDRMVTELRRANQAPTSVSVSLPPFPSTERVGVFVDVANLLYSARTLRIAVDFGKLLDFLRGNRRLVRAHAYCPTSPQAGDEQMFLQAVKGLGYRITTKNYKTFSSGAKKADLDLDLCMDVVRLVDGRAVDCIVLVSGDSDFMPMLDYCSDHGVRVEVAAFDEAMSATLRQSCDLFVNLSMLEEIRS